MAVKEAPFMGNFSGRVSPDDGRPRTPTPIEQLHCDIAHAGPSSYGVYHPREMPDGFDIVMHFGELRD